MENESRKCVGRRRRIKTPKPAAQAGFYFYRRRNLTIMVYIFLLSLVTACVAGSAAFFSVYGLGHTFAGAFWTVVFMGGSLEAGKLMTASFLYRYNAHVSWRMKIPAYAFVLALMGVTSVGIYGYLSAAYQSDTVTLKQIKADIELKQKELDILQKRKESIDAQIAQLPSNVVKGRQKLLQQFKGESEGVMSRINALTQDIQSLTQRKITSESHVGPIMFIAEVCNVPPDKAINVLMLVIIFAFDPLAILLTIAVNVAIKVRADEKNIIAQQPSDEICAKDDGVLCVPELEPPHEPQLELENVEVEIEPTSDESSSGVADDAFFKNQISSTSRVEEDVDQPSTQNQIVDKPPITSEAETLARTNINIDDIDLIALDDCERSLNKEPHFYYTQQKIPSGQSKADIVADFRRL